jgi:hypothetical protein
MRKRMLLRKLMKSLKRVGRKERRPLLKGKGVASCLWLIDWQR